MNHALEQASATADRLRGELLRTIEELERRGERARDWRAQLRRHWPWVLGGAGILVLGTGANVALAVWSRQRHVRRLPERRREAVRRTWSHPERLARPQPKVPVRIAQALVVYASSKVAVWVVRRGARKVVG